MWSAVDPRSSVNHTTLLAPPRLVASYQSTLRPLHASNSSLHKSEEAIWRSDVAFGHGVALVPPRKLAG